MALWRKSDPVKMDPARIMRRETTLPLQWICDLLEMGAWKSINQRLYGQSTQKVEMLGTDLSPFTTDATSCPRISSFFDMR